LGINKKSDMKRVLVPVDFSRDSMNALNAAISVANKIESDIRFIHVRKNKDYDEPFVIEGKEQDYGQTVEEFCGQIVREYRKKLKKGNMDYVIRHGKIYKGIIEQARHDRSGLIMMGTHGVSGFEEFWLGSNAYRVVSKAPCPVITVRHGFKRKKFGKILLPIDFKRDTRQKIPFTTELARLLNAEVHVVDFRSTDRTDIKIRLKKYADQAYDYVTGHGVKAVRSSKKGGDIPETIISYAVHEDIDLISIVTFERGTPANMALSTNAQLMVNHSPIPILSIHPSTRK